MNQATCDKLQAAMDYCNESDKSTEFMLQYMQDAAGVDFDTVMDFLEEQESFEETHNYDA